MADKENGEPDQPDEGSLKLADKVSGPVGDDAEQNDPPVRSNRPDVPLIQTLTVGAGAHTPPDDDAFDEAGRYVGEGKAKTAAASRETATARSASSKETR